MSESPREPIATPNAESAGNGRLATEPSELPQAGLPQLAARAVGTTDPQDQGREAPRPWVWARVRDISWALLGIAGLIYVAFWALKWVTSVLLLFVLAALLAFIIQPLVGSMERRLGLSRVYAALIAYIAVVGVFGTLVAWGASQLADQISAVISNLPAYYQALENRIPDLEERIRALGFSVDIAALQSQLQSALPEGGVLASRGVEVAAKAGDVALNVFLLLFLSFYLVIDGDRLFASLLVVSPPRWKPYVLFVQRTLLRVVGGYLRGQLLMGAIIGVSVFVGALVLGIRYSLVLGVLGFFFEMVPMIGPTLIGAAMVLSALLTSFKLALIALVFYLLLQLLESNVLGPRITGHAVGLHPIASMLGLVAGAKLFGLWGALFAVPVLGFAFVVIAAVYRQVQGLDPEALLTPRHQPAHWPVPHPPPVWERFRRHAPDSAQEANSAPAPISMQEAGSAHAREEPVGVASAPPERSGDLDSDQDENEGGGDAAATVSPAATVRPDPGHAA